jgi:hypothetical protein
MIKKLLKYCKVIPIDALIYVMKQDAVADFPVLNFTIESETVNANRKRFFIKEANKVVHESFLFEKLFILRLIGKTGPTIGDCRTVEAFKGKSIYPFVINYIAREEILKNHRKEVFIIVHPNNLSSIKGIEKAGFQLHTKVNAKRFLFFHFNIKKG